MSSPERVPANNGAPERITLPCGQLAAHAAVLCAWEALEMARPFTGFEVRHVEAGAWYNRCTAVGADGTDCVIVAYAHPDGTISSTPPATAQRLPDLQA